MGGPSETVVPIAGATIQVFCQVLPRSFLQHQAPEVFARFLQAGRGKISPPRTF